MELSRLSQLGLLYLSYNHLTESIPVELSQLSKLRTLALRNNQLTGPIPVELGQLSQLQRLHLNHNQLTERFRSSWPSCSTCSDCFFTTTS